MTEELTAVINSLKSYGIVKDPQLLNRLDEPVSLRVVLELLHQVMLRIEPPRQPYD